MPDSNNYTDPTNNEMSEMIQSRQMNQNQDGTRPNMPSPDPTDQDTFAEILSANIGAYVLIQFLIGSTSLVDKEGYLYAVGQNFVTLYEPLDDRYVVCDLYSVKFVSIFNTTPAGSMARTNNAMNYSQNSSQGRYIRNYSQNNRRTY